MIVEGFDDLEVTSDELKPKVKARRRLVKEKQLLADQCRYMDTL